MIDSLAYLGTGAIVYPSARIIHPERLSLGDYSTIDDFVFLNAGEGTTIGRYAHIATHVSIIGGGRLEVGDYAVIAAGARVLTATDTFRDGSRMSTHLPAEFRAVQLGKVTLESDAFVGANAVIMPGVTLGEGAVAGACALVSKDLEPWTVYVGVPARAIKPRPRPTRPGP